LNAKADAILSTARNLVTSDRASDYGPMKHNMDTIAKFWNVYLHCRPSGRSDIIDGEDVAMMLALMKVARICGGPFKDDSYIDLAGYAAVAGQVAYERETPQEQADERDG